jgi:cyclophilin family peptidyl-prolyl cis-trans isomerase
MALVSMSAAALAQPKEPAQEPAKAPAPGPETKAPAPAPEAAKLVYVKMTTTEGDIYLELNETAAPITVKNFLSYVDKGFYTGTVFHRVINDFMIQGGGFTVDGTQKPTEAPIKNEWRNGLKNKKGTIAMARTQIADSATSQFFINVVDNAMLDAARDGAAYCVFGRVVGGQDVVEKIRKGEVTKGPMDQKPSKPVKPVEIKGVSRSTAEEANKAGKPAEAPAKDAKKDEPKKEEQKGN